MDAAPVYSLNINTLSFPEALKFFSAPRLAVDRSQVVRLHLEVSLEGLVGRVHRGAFDLLRGTELPEGLGGAVMRSPVKIHVFDA